MAKGEKIAAKFAGYVSGMETDSNFEAVSFFWEVPEAIRGDVKETNKLRSQKIAEFSKKYGVKPLGAVAASGLKGINKAFVLALIDAAKKQNMALETAVERYNGRYPEHGLTVEKVKEIQKAATQAAKDLLA